MMGAGWETLPLIQHVLLGTGRPSPSRVGCGVPVQGHRCEALHQGNRHGAQNQGHLWNWLSPFVRAC